jgi:hypothetical protein
MPTIQAHHGCEILIRPLGQPRRVTSSVNARQGRSLFRLGFSASEIVRFDCREWYLAFWGCAGPRPPPFRMVMCEPKRFGILRPEDGSDRRDELAETTLRAEARVAKGCRCYFCQNGFWISLKASKRVIPMSAGSRSLRLSTSYRDMMRCHHLPNDAANSLQPCRRQVGVAILLS